MSLGDRPTLLLVDDEPDILVALTDVLEEGYRILSATEPARALAMLEQETEVAVIISDQRMPGMNGDVFLAAARQVSDAEAILLTGYADLGAVTSALNQGGISGYATKPWEPEPLRVMVDAAAERHRLKRALRREERLLEGLMEHLPAAVAFKDREGRLIRVNSRKAEALGCDRQACLGRTEAELVGRAPPAAESEAGDALLPRQVLEEVEGETGANWIEADYVPIPDAAGRLEYMVVIERDVTVQKEAELRLRQVDKLRALGTLAGGVAHDFNNLLTAILGSLELARRPSADAGRVRRYLENAAMAAQRGAALTQRLLGFSRQEDSRVQVIDARACLISAEDLVTRTLGGAVRIEWRVPEGLWPISAEPDQLELAVLNLCVNARDAMAQGGVITISGENVARPADPAAELPAGDYVRLTVSDQGAGMSPEVLSRVLEPFFTTKPVGKGTGLGLPMVYGFVQRSGGAMEIDSTPGEGTSVSLFLPRSVDVGAATPEEDDGGGLPGDLVQARRILLVDDDAAVRQVTAGLLAELGHQVAEAESGRGALQVLARGTERFDLAVVDFAMPHMNGLEFHRRARQGRADLPIVLVTGHAELSEIPKDLVLLRKPFDVAGLRRALAQALAGQARETLKAI